MALVAIGIAAYLMARPAPPHFPQYIDTPLQTQQAQARLAELTQAYAQRQHRLARELENASHTGTSPDFIQAEAELDLTELALEMYAIRQAAGLPQPAPK